MAARVIINRVWPVYIFSYYAGLLAIVWIICLNYLSSSLQTLLGKIVQSNNGFSSHVSSDKSRSVEMVSASKSTSTHALSSTNTENNGGSSQQLTASPSTLTEDGDVELQITIKGSDPRNALHKFKRMVRNLSIIGVVCTLSLWTLATAFLLTKADEKFESEECQGEKDQPGCAKYVYVEGFLFLLQLVTLYILFRYAWGPLEMTCDPEKTTCSKRDVAYENSRS